MPWNLWPCCLVIPLTPESWYVRHELLLPFVQPTMWIINAKTVCDDDSTSHSADPLNIKLTISCTIFCQCCPFPHQCNFVRVWVNHRADLDVWEMRYILASARVRTSILPAHFHKVVIPYLPKDPNLKPSCRRRSLLCRRLSMLALQNLCNVCIDSAAVIFWKLYLFYHSADKLILLSSIFSCVLAASCLAFRILTFF